MSAETPSQPPVRCTCISARPGRAVLPPSSILRAPGGMEILEARPAATMFRPSITIVPCSTGVPPLPSTMRTLVNAMDCALAEVLSIPAAARANRNRSCMGPAWRIRSKVRFSFRFVEPRTTRSEINLRSQLHQSRGSSGQNLPECPIRRKAVAETALRIIELGVIENIEWFPPQLQPPRLATECNPFMQYKVCLVQPMPARKKLRLASPITPNGGV